MNARKRWTLVAAVLGSSIVFLDSAVVSVALPAIGREPRLFVDVLEGENYIQFGYLLFPWSSLLADPGWRVVRLLTVGAACS